MKKRVAVLFGGRSPEHDVSIITGLQALQALDLEAFDPFPVYLSTEGAWYVGDLLLNRETYIPSAAKLEQLEQVVLDLRPNIAGRGRLMPAEAKGFFGRAKSIEFDVALLAFHGLFGEDGRIQSLFEIANVPYTGMRPLASSVLMDKAATKRILASADIPLLPYHVLHRPEEGLIPSDAAINKASQEISYPAVVKPLRLGSSIGVAKVSSNEELKYAAAEIFRLDTEAIVESFVENLVEYNVSVCALGGEIRTSAIERPKRSEELLDFRSKYMSGGKGVSKTKTPGEHSHGMLSLTRDINPNLPDKAIANIKMWSEKCFALVYGSGAPRIDYISNAVTGEIWLNEVNPCPGSFAFFLWEVAKSPMLFSDLLAGLIKEAFTSHRMLQLPQDPTHKDARLFRRT